MYQSQSFYLPFLLLLLLAGAVEAQPGTQVTDEEGRAAYHLVYKTIDTTELAMRMYYPEPFETGRAYPAVVFFFGGGWRGGTLEQFAPHARHYAERGLIAILADYRVESRHGTTPFDAVRDAKSAIRLLRKRADAWSIDPERIVAAGGSAGGHLAAAAATIEGLNEPGEDTSISARPNALLLFNPVFDNGPQGYGYDRVGGAARFREISPLHNIRAGSPPAIIFLGTQDRLVPVETAVAYCRRMEAVDAYCELHLYGQQPHGFFNARSPEFYQKTLAAADAFLHALGYLSNP